MKKDMTQSTHIAALPKWVRVKLYAQISGITEDAISKKRQNGVWLQGVHWRKAPDGNVMINWQACDAWVETGHTYTH